MTSHTKPLVAALSFYVLWTFGTWLMEGRIETFLRPEAVLDRLLYALVINLLLGILCGLFLIRALVRWGGLTLQSAGFSSPARSIIAAIVGLVLGFAFYRLAGGASSDPVVLINAFCQVFVVSTAEVLVCWTIVAATVEGLFRETRRWLAIPIAAVVASVLFGAYHFAHSAPFNTVPMVTFLSAIGLITSIFFFVSRNVYGTIMFHNFLAVLGVVNALTAQNLLGQFSALQTPLIVTALVAAILTGILHYFALYRAGRTKRSG